MRDRRLAVGLIALLTICASALGEAPALRSPFRTQSAGKLQARRARVGEEPLDFDAPALAALRAAADGPLFVSDFPVAPGVRTTVMLRRFSIATPDAHMRVTGPSGDKLLPLPDVAHFSGRVVGEPDSTVYVGARPDGLHALVRSSAGASYVGPDEAESGYVVRDSASPSNSTYDTSAFTCAAESLPVPPAAAASRTKALADAPDVVGFQKGGLIVETDQELLAKFADADHMTAYVLSLFALVDLIYERDLSFHFSVSEVHVWNGVADPWNGPSTVDQLNQLGTWYHANRPIASYPRSTVHLVSGLPVSGGVAWLQALCIPDFDAGSGDWGGGYGISQVFGNYPAQNWDLIVTSHELGHNTGSVHTHCYVPPIDQCFSGEINNGVPCYSGPTSVPPGGGTLMSYCHLLPPGESNINLLFHQRCIDEQLLPFIQGSTCLTAVTTFPDVPTSSPFFHYVETIFKDGITGGCSGGNYCPGNPVTRAQMAVFLLKAKNGSAYTPPACSGKFDDVACPGPFTNWIEELANEGITGGCGGNSYCPDATVTRKQMAPFLLKTLKGSAHTPPACSGVFTDVACPGTFTSWIEELYGMGITGGCSSSPLKYCPDNPNTRAQMAVFLVKTFLLTW